MTKFYYQIKAKASSRYGSSNWEWPPVFSGMVEADNKKEAKKIIDDDYGKQFPLRVLNKDLDKHHFLLNIREIADNDQRTLKLFEVLNCEECECSFRIIDKYNDHHENDKGTNFCSYDCRKISLERNRFNRFVEENVNGSAYIYRITNKKNKMTYVGKTQQAFTLRWYQHFYQGGDTKFHKAIKEVPLKNWVFEILEVIKKNPTEKDFLGFVLKRESHWMKKFDSIENGYNSVISKKDFDDDFQLDNSDEKTTNEIIEG